LLPHLLSLSNAISIFNIISSRVKFYINWPYKYLFIVKLAAAGFYHVVDTKKDDAIKYDYYDEQIYNWFDCDKSVDRIMMEHKIDYP